MSPRLALVFALTACGAPTLSESAEGGSPTLAEAAVDPDPAVAVAAREALRARGPAGLVVLLRAHADAVAALRAGETPPHAERLRAAIDHVSAQRDGHASGLYWHTDLEAAREEAEARGRPILSLRLLGRLDEEMSCANSRYFRTLLYPAPAVRERLAERFVLHWASERPAPRITVDMGDGRRIERTITGNSVHYVLDSRLRVIDLLPGLYAPAQFAAHLDGAAAAFARCGALDADAHRACVTDHHREALAALGAAWEAERAIHPRLPYLRVLTTLPPRVEDAPTASAAMMLTLGKARVETPLLDGMTRSPRVPMPELVDWEAVFGERASTRRASDAVIALIALKTGADGAAERAHEATRVAALDGFRNDYTLRARGRPWLMERVSPDLEALNGRVYSELFLTPASDPWLGLRSEPLWDGLEVAR